MQKQKPLVWELEETRNVIQSKMSNLKSTCKAYISFFNEYDAIIRNTAEQLLKLSRKTTGEVNIRKKNLIECKVFENDTIRSSIDLTLQFVLKSTDQLDQLSQRIKTDIIKNLNYVYAEARTIKTKMLAQIGESKKNRDACQDRLTKKEQQYHQMLSAHKYGTSQIAQIDNEVQDAKHKLDSCQEQTINELIQDVQQAEFHENVKNKQISVSILSFLSYHNKFVLRNNPRFIENLSILSQNITSAVKSLPEAEGEQVYRETKMALVKTMKSLSKQTQVVVREESPQKGRSTNLKQQHKDILVEVRRRLGRRPFKPNILPPLIQHQVGIFNDLIPHSLQHNPFESQRPLERIPRS